MSPAGSGPWNLGCRARGRWQAGWEAAPHPPGGLYAAAVVRVCPREVGGGLLHKTDLLLLNLINQILPERASCSCWQVSVGEISDVARPSKGERRGSHKS